MNTLGIAKTTFNSSVALIESDGDDVSSVEILLTERLTRKKCSGAWPIDALEIAQKRFGSLEEIEFFENRPVVTPAQYEERLGEKIPLAETLRQKKLSRFLSCNSSRLIPHHFSHALSALAQMPYDTAIILVVDGAGSKADVVTSFSVGETLNEFLPATLSPNLTEEVSAYLYRDSTLRPIFKRWQQFIKHNDRYISNGLGNLYESVSEYIFNDKNSAGKVMGLSAYGSDVPINSPEEFVKALNWKYSFVGQGKGEWESSPNFELYSSIASSVQNYFEQDYFSILVEIKKRFPNVENLVLTGGCALNCTNNMKIYRSKLFQSIYVPPFPGDEGISLGLAYWPLFKKGIRSCHFNSSYFGSIDNQPNDTAIMKIFSHDKTTHLKDIATHTAKKIAEGKIVAWYQGRSECGPRALGNRSILCRVDRSDAKNHLNTNVKFREFFRPYACSITQESVHKFFDLPKNFDNSYMSFACKAKKEYQNLFKEVTHVDNTSRLQTVLMSQNKIFYELLVEVEKLTGIPAVLNTSLNVMGEPIVESLLDAKRFFDEGRVDGMVVGNFYIESPL